MNKIAFLYPGQGSQIVGMGRDFYENSKISRNVYDKASEILGFDVPALCFEENELLNRTDYTQAALVTTCIAMTKAIEEEGLRPNITAGLSLGEYCAIETAGGMSFEDAVKVIWRRGNLMHHAVPDGSGGMAAVLGLSGEQVKAVTDTSGEVTVANYNCPGQIVITGKKAGIEELTPVLKEVGAKRVLPLNVSGPFHSPYLKEAGEALYDTLKEVRWKPLEIPYVTNVTAEMIDDISMTAELLKQQVYSSVMWEQSIRNMLANEIDLFVEIGPGKTLSGFMKKINRKIPIYRIGTWEEMKNVVSQIKELN
ncbi:MAG: ACP S-malonyltransferase [Lachnospiraceae bacterium]|nr:ACP S-malonyltransferase [Lachnospiraceae bacterium]